MATPRNRVEAPPVTPLPFGLFSAAVVLDDLDGTNGFGTYYEPDYCGPAYDSLGVCVTHDFGTLSISVADTGEATITSADAPESAYSVSWGDGSDDETGGPAPDDLGPYTYAAPGDYTVVVTDDSYGYRAVVTVTVTDGEASGPFDATVAFSKVTRDGIDVVAGDPFLLYHLLSCRAPGGGFGQVADRARAALRLGEQRAVERVLATQLPLMDGAVDLTPTAGTAVHPVDGLAILEGYAGRTYGGVPVVHTTRPVGTVLTTVGAVQRVGTGLETVQGARVSSGGGYEGNLGPAFLAGPSDDGPVAPGAGQAWLYVTGQVVVRRSSTIEVGPIAQQTPRDNTVLALAERLAQVTTECITAAVLVSTSYSTGGGGGGDVDGGSP